MAGSAIVPLDCVASMTNMRLIRNYEVGKRPGLRSLGTIVTGQALYPNKLQSGNNLLAVGNNTGRAGVTAFVPGLGSPSLAAVTPITFGTYATGFSSAQFRDATADVMYVGVYSPAHGILKYAAGGTITEEIGTASVTGLNQIWVYNQRLFGCKGDQMVGGTATAAGAASQILYYSGLNNGDTIGAAASGGGSAAIRTYGGQNIVGGFALGASNFILHENAISVFRGTTFDDINIAAGAQGVSPNIGYPLAWKTIGGVGYVLTMSGLYIATEGGFAPAGTPQYPDPIAQLLLDIPTTVSSELRASSPWFILDNARRREVWCIVNIRNNATGISAASLFIYSPQLGRFTGQGSFGVPIDWACTAYDSFNGVNQQMLFVSGATVLGCDFLHDTTQVYADNGSNFASSVQLRRMYTGQDPSAVKSWRHMSVQMGSGAGETPLSIGATTGATAKYVNATGSVTSTVSLVAQQSSTVQLSGQGNALDITITDNGTISVGWSLMRAEVEGYAYTRRPG